LVVEVVRQVADEQAVYLDRVGLQVLEVGERGKPGAEIVEARAAPGLAQRLDETPRVVQVGNRGSFGELDQQPVRGDAAAAQLLGDVLRQRRLVERAAGDIDCRRPAARSRA
jgi:hypothetical protein